MVVAQTTGGVTTRVRFPALILTSVGSKSGTPFYPNYRNRVNTVLRFCENSSEGRSLAQDADTCTRGRVRTPETECYLKRLGLKFNSISPRRLRCSPVIAKSHGVGDFMGGAEAWDAAWATAPF
jgi:hypothetical protein